MEMARVIVIKDNQVMEAFNKNRLKGSLKEAFESTGRSYSEELLDMLTDETVKKLNLIGTELYSEDIFHAIQDILDENGYDEEAFAYKLKYRKMTQVNLIKNK